MENRTENTNDQLCVDQDEVQGFLEELCEELDGVIPTEILDMISHVKPIEAAIRLLWDFGGSIRQNNPEVNLVGDYGYPEEVNELNDNIGSYSFTIMDSPFIALVKAASAKQDFNEEIIMSRELDGYVPIAIKKDDEVKRLCIVDYKNHTLQITIGIGLRLDVDMTGDHNSREEAMKKSLNDLDDYLDDLKQVMSKELKIFDDPEEEQAVLAWCNMHSYTPQGIFRSSIDSYF